MSGRKDFIQQPAEQPITNKGHSEGFPWPWYGFRLVEHNWLVKPIGVLRFSTMGLRLQRLSFECRTSLLFQMQVHPGTWLVLPGTV